MNKKLILTLCLAILASQLTECGNATTQELSSSNTTTPQEQSSSSSSASESTTPQSENSTSESTAEKPQSEGSNLGSAVILTLADLSDIQLGIFKKVSEMRVDEVKGGKLTVDELNEYHLDVLTKDYREQYGLPANYAGLFMEWKDSTDYYKQFEKKDEKPTEKPKPEQKPSGNSGNAGNSGNYEQYNPPIVLNPIPQEEKDAMTEALGGGGGKTDWSDYEW